jgi:hypothetical protein
MLDRLVPFMIVILTWGRIYWKGFLNLTAKTLKSKIKFNIR